MIYKEKIIKQLNDTSNKIVRNYRKLYSKEMDEIVDELTVSYENLISVIDRENQKETTDNDFQSALIFWSGTNTLLSSIELFSRGYPREHLVILRHALELISTAYCVHIKPEIMDDLLKNVNINSTKHISEAKKVCPIMGLMYGMLSNSFMHVSTMHIVPNNSKNPFCVGGMFDKNDQQYKPLVLSMILTTAEILNIFIEIVFFDKISKKRYWEYIGKGNVKYQPLESIRNRQKNILKSMEDVF